MSSLLYDLLAERRFGLTLVAGGDQMASREPCRWVHIFDLFDRVDPASWLKGGELVLTSGLSISEAPTLQRDFVERLASCGCYALGYSGDLAPPAMIEEADRVGLPLFTIPYGLPLIEVTQFVAHHIIQRQYAGLRRALGLHRQLLNAVTANCGLDDLLRIVGAQMPGFAFRVLDYFGRPRAEWNVDGLLDEVDTEQVRAEVVRTADGTGSIMVSGDGLFLVGRPVRIERQIEAVLVAVGRRALDEAETLLFDQSLASVSITVSRELSTRKARRALVDELLSGIATGTASHQVLLERTRRLGLTTDGKVTFLCVPVPPDIDLSLVCATVEDAIPDSGPVVGTWDRMVYALVEGSDSAAVPVFRALRRQGWPAVVGRSRVHIGVDGLVTGFREAQTAACRAPANKGICGIEDIGVAFLLSSVESTDLSNIIITRVLGPLINHDRAEGTSLVSSLDAYLRNGCRPGPAAKELFIHRHTLTYRLDRIAHMTGRDPRDGAHLLDFAVALQLYRDRDRTHGDAE